MHSMSLNKNHFRSASVYHHVLSGWHVEKDLLQKVIYTRMFLFFFPNQLVKCNNTQVFSKTKGSQPAHVSTGQIGICTELLEWENAKVTVCTWTFATWSALVPWEEKQTQETHLHSTHLVEHLQCAGCCGKWCFFPLLSFQWHWTHSQDSCHSQLRGRVSHAVRQGSMLRRTSQLA